MSVVTSLRAERQGHRSSVPLRGTDVFLFKIVQTPCEEPGALSLKGGHLPPSS